jgi:hypothetical protein
MSIARSNAIQRAEGWRWRAGAARPHGPGPDPVQHAVRRAEEQRAVRVDPGTRSDDGGSAVGRPADGGVAERVACPERRQRVGVEVRPLGDREHRRVRWRRRVPHDRDPDRRPASRTSRSRRTRPGGPRPGAATLIPTPTTTWEQRSPSHVASQRIPPSLRPSTVRSLGHFTAGRAGAQKGSSASASAAPTRSGSEPGAASRAGRRSTESQMPSPGADSQRLPARPRPSVCDSATTHVPAGYPCRASLEMQIVRRADAVEDEELGDRPPRAERSGRNPGPRVRRRGDPGRRRPLRHRGSAARGRAPARSA